MSRPPILHVSQNPAPSLLSGPVRLYKHTWEDHVMVKHPEVDYFDVRQAMDDPCYICSSATVPGTYVLVSELAASGSGQALRVPVKPITGDNVVTTAYYSAASQHGVVMWKRGDG